MFGPKHLGLWLIAGGGGSGGGGGDRIGAVVGGRKAEADAAHHLVPAATGDLARGTVGRVRPLPAAAAAAALLLLRNCSRQSGVGRCGFGGGLDGPLYRSIGFTMVKVP